MPTPPAKPDLNESIARFLATLPLFADVSAAEAMDVVLLLRKVDLQPGEKLFEAGDPPSSMWLLGEGCEVEISMVPAPGAPPVAMFTSAAGDTVGEMALIDDAPRSGTATVVKAGTAQRIEAADFEALRARFHPAAFKMLRKLAITMARRLRVNASRLAPETPESAAGGVAPTRLPEGKKVTPESLRALSPFDRLPASVRLALSQKLRENVLTPGQVVFRQGEPGEFLIILEEGDVALIRQGHELARLEPGALCGVVSAVDGGARVADCIAVAPSRVLRLSRPDLEWLFQSGNRFAYQIVDAVVRQMVSRLRALNLSLVAQCETHSEPERAQLEAQAAGGALDLDLDIDLEDLPILEPLPLEEDETL
ncbi:MAG TPA: cyclic nucleotide-binding domain-containing protein [Myxococcales bacterium]|jgi:CRP-like cAMP-binding protein